MIWYHISSTWKGTTIKVKPRSGRYDDPEDPRDLEPFIAVCPTIAQCVIALGAWREYDVMRVFKTSSKIKPDPATWVFDYSLTDEHRFREETIFKYVGDIDVELLVQSIPYRRTNAISDAAILKALKLDLPEIQKHLKKIM